MRVPEWVSVLQAAHEWGVPPWVVEEQCSEEWWWRYATYRAAENKAAEDIRSKATKRR